MPDWLQLYAILWALRALEHLQWRPAGTVLFEGRSPGRFRTRPMPSGSTETSAIVLTNPFRFLGRVFRSGPVAASLDVRRVSALLARLDSISGRVLRAEAALSLHLFVIIPAVWATMGLARSWPYLAGGVVILHAATIAALHDALGRMGVTGRGDRWQRLMPFLLSPPAATEAMLGLTKELLRESHPVAIAAVLCDETAFREIAIRSLRHAQFPGVDPGAGGTAAAQVESVIELRSVIAARLGVADVALPDPPRTSACALWYCPRCLAEYSSFAASCTDCEGVALKAFDGG